MEAGPLLSSYNDIKSSVVQYYIGVSGSNALWGFPFNPSLNHSHQGSFPQYIDRHLHTWYRWRLIYDYYVLFYYVKNGQEWARYSLVQEIIVTSLGRKGVSNHRQLNCLFIPLFRIKAEKTPKHHIILWGESICELKGGEGIQRVKWLLSEEKEDYKFFLTFDPLYLILFTTSWWYMIDISTSVSLERWGDTSS